MRKHITSPAQIAEEFAALIHGLTIRQLADAANCSTETAKGWKAGRACPGAANLINLSRHIPDVRRWLELQIEDQEPPPLDWKPQSTARLA